MSYTSKEVYEFISKQTNDPIVERKTCAISRQPFAIFQSDLDFYNKISPTFAGQKFPIPTPTLCPEERQRRRLLFNNQRKFYKRKCDATGESIISIYSSDKIDKVYEQKYRRSDKCNNDSYFIEFDGTKLFFEQFKDLHLNIPKMSLFVDGNENADYANMAGRNKNCYLVSNSDHNEDCYYTQDTYYSKNSIDCLFSYQMNITYSCIDCNNCFNSFFCVGCNDSQNISFCSHCNNCQNCFGCTNLANTEYAIGNIKYNKEEYENKVTILQSLSLNELHKQISQFYQGSLVLGSTGNNNQDSYGNNILNSKESIFCFDSINLEGCKYCTNMKGAKSCHDTTRWGHPGELCYESTGTGEGAYQILFCYNSRGNSSNLYYCSNCVYSSHCFGCIGLRNKSYCIFNKQYTKEEYETTVAKIITHMQETGERGEFFHPSLSPFGYNETVAQEYFPLTREEALSRGYQRQDNNYDPIIPEGAKVIDFRRSEQSTTSVLRGSEGSPNYENLNNRILSSGTGELEGAEILKSIFICEVSGRPYRIIKQELEFYRKHSLPLPKRHPDVRHEERMKLRPGRTLYLRNCDKCGKEMLSVYPNIIATSRKSQATGQGTGNLSLEAGSQKVYCEDCYQKEIYS